MRVSGRRIGLRDFDVFPKVEDDSGLIERSWLGGLLSLIVLVALGAVLVIVVFIDARPQDMRKLAFNDRPLPPSMKIFMAVLVMNRCGNLHFDVTTLKKRSIVQKDGHANMETVNRSCRVVVNVEVPTVSGEFHIGLGENAPEGVLQQHRHVIMLLDDRNISHVVEVMRFGDFADFETRGLDWFTSRRSPYELTYELELLPVRSGRGESQIGYLATGSMVKANLDKTPGRGAAGIVFRWTFAEVAVAWDVSSAGRWELWGHVLGVAGGFLLAVRFVGWIVS